MAFKEREAALSAGSVVGERLFPVKQKMKLAPISRTKSGTNNSVTVVEPSVVKMSFGGWGLSSVV